MEKEKSNTNSKTNSWFVESLIYKYPCLLQSDQGPIPLKKIDYKVAINGGLANVTLTQDYFNNLDTSINVNYQFPISSEAVFGGIEVYFKNRKIVGEIKEKKQAKAEFEKNKNEGNTVAYAEKLKDSEDIMKMELGNFPPKESLNISFKYILKLDVINKVYWGFRIASTLTPRYTPVQVEGGEMPAQEEALPLVNPHLPSHTQVGKYPWSIDIKIFSPKESGVKTVRSLTHNDKVEITKSNEVINIKFKDSCGAQYPNRDFEIVIEDENLFVNSAQVAISNLPSVTGDIPKYAAMMQFIPSMYKWYSEKGTNWDKGIDLYSEEKTDFLMDSTQAEFIFVLDRSGSMQGNRMTKAITALIFFLKSLPYNSKFNVVSFGSGFLNMFPQSVGYTNENLNIAIAQIQKMEANLGGTEILKPLKSIFSQTKDPNFQRNIFLLTDGDISNINQVLLLVEENCIYNMNKVFSIGLGDGCSEQLVRRTAQIGGGKSIFITSKDNTEGKIVSLLNECLTPSLTNFQVEFDEKYISAISPLPNMYSNLLGGEPFTMFALLKNDLENVADKSTEVSVSFFNSVSRTTETRVFKLELEGAIVDSSFHTMCVNYLLENQKRINNLSYLDPALNESPDIHNKLAVAYQVLSAEHTAFICLISKNENGEFKATQDVIVPVLEAFYGEDEYESGSESDVSMGGLFDDSDSCGGGYGGGGVYSTPVKKTGSRPVQYKTYAPGEDKPEEESVSMGGGLFDDDSDDDEDDAPLPKKTKPNTALKPAPTPISTKVPVPTPAPVPKTKSEYILMKQQIQGYWKFDLPFLLSLGFKKSDIESLETDIPNPDCLMTLLILAYMNIEEDSSSFLIIKNKASGYLRKNKVANCPELIAKAENMLDYTLTL